MNTSNHPVTSREYKLILNVDRFKDREQGAQIFYGLVEVLIKKTGGTIVEKQNNEEEKRRTSYLDTPDLTLRQHGFALRLREEAKDNEFQINLKYREPDRYISAAQDLSGPQAGKTKFEEDILPPFVSKFAYSTSIKTDAKPDLSSMEKAIAIFPGLKRLNTGWMNFNITTKTAFALEVL